MNSKFLLPFNLGILEFLELIKIRLKIISVSFKKRLLLGKFLRVGRLKP